jgi:hypothetical protein
LRNIADPIMTIECVWKSKPSKGKLEGKIKTITGVGQITEIYHLIPPEPYSVSKVEINRSSLSRV